MNKRLILFLKVAVMGTVAVMVGIKLREAWLSVQGQKINVQWAWGLLALAGFCASMLTGALVWRWLARKMGAARNGTKGDGLPSVPLVGAYTFSQLGKYIPGKVGLLLMRIERSDRVGMKASVCTMATLLENALYMVSGGLVGMAAIVRILRELREQGKINAFQEQWQWPLIGVVMAVLLAACHPKIFYGVVNWALWKTKKPEIPARQRLGMGTLALVILGFVPCWALGGMALWASTRCVQEVALVDCVWFAGAFALSVILGMASLIPGGIGVRELVLGAAVTLQLTPAIGHPRAMLIGGAAAVLQRLFQVVAEVLLGLGGWLVTGRGGKKNLPPASATVQSSS